MHHGQRAGWLEALDLSDQAHQLPAIDGSRVGEAAVVGLDFTRSDPVVENGAHSTGELLSAGAVKTLGVLFLERGRPM